MTRLARTLVLLPALVGLAGAAAAAGPELVSVQKIWDAGAHNAFTDLIRWRGAWYCTFREADGHVGGDGVLRVLTSADGERWESAAAITEAGIDLRDPKLCVAPDGRLMIVAGGSVYQGKTLVGRQPRVTFSADGRTWTPPRRVLSEGEWLWRVTWHGGVAYGASYRSGAPGADAEWGLTLFKSNDGVAYERVTKLDVPGRPNETTLRFLPDDTMVALVRREAGDKVGWIGRSRPPYTSWTWAKTAQRLGGPNFLRTPDGALWAAGRLHTQGSGSKTAVARMDVDGRYEPVLTLPSGGDTSYPGLVWHDGQLWMSYYASHEGKTSIYLARIRLPLEPEPIGARLEPFVDEHLIDRLDGAEVRVQRPAPSDVVLTADRPWEGNTSAYFTVFRDGDRFRMYYRGSHFNESTKTSAHPEVTCYAESRDGLRWEKPELGLFEFEGSKANNIVWAGEGGHNFAPFLDANPACTPDARYKALAGDRRGLIPLRSADGLRWDRMSPTPVITRGAFDSQNIAFFDTVLGRYREYHRHFRGVRDIMTGTSSDFLHWTGPEFLDYPDAPPEHLYTNAVLPHPGAPHVLVGFPTRFLPPKEQTEPTFMASRDGRTFRRFAEAVIPRTAPKDRDGNRCNYMARGVLELPGRPDELSVYAIEAYYTGPASRVRRFVYRRDGFTALESTAGRGRAETRPITFAGKSLVLNAQGTVRVEVRDADGRPVDGYALADCRPVTGDATRSVVAWAGGPDLGALAGRPVRLVFELSDATLYSFRFE